MFDHINVVTSHKHKLCPKTPAYIRHSNSRKNGIYRAFIFYWAIKNFNNSNTVLDNKIWFSCHEDTPLNFLFGLFSISYLERFSFCDVFPSTWFPGFGAKSVKHISFKNFRQVIFCFGSSVTLKSFKMEVNIPRYIVLVSNIVSSRRYWNIFIWQIAMRSTLHCMTSSRERFIWTAVTFSHLLILEFFPIGYHARYLY